MAEEKQFNPRLTKTKEEFVELMNNLGLPYPKMIGEFGRTVNLELKKESKITTQFQRNFFL